MEEREFVLEIARALSELRSTSPDELGRVGRPRGWLVVQRVSGLWEMGERYPIVLDTIVQPPIVLCPFLGTEEVARSERRRVLRESYESMRRVLLEVLGDSCVSLEWSASAWAATIWERECVSLSVEEASYEGEAPFLAVVCEEKRAHSAPPSVGLSARLSSQAGT